MRTAATAVPFTDEEIAQVVHEAIRGLQYVQNDPSPSDPWQVADVETRETVIASVRRARQSQVSPREHHDAWVRARTAQGWRWGPVKNAADKTHPLLVPYYDLEPGQRLKDELSLDIIVRMASQPLGESPMGAGEFDSPETALIREQGGALSGSMPCVSPDERWQRLLGTYGEYHRNSPLVQAAKSVIADREVTIAALQAQLDAYQGRMVYYCLGAALEQSASQITDAAEGSVLRATDTGQELVFERGEWLER